MGIDRLRLICSHVFLFLEVLSIYTVLNLQYDMRKISRESVFEVIVFRLWVYELLAVNMAILQMAYILFTELTGEIGSNQK